MNPLNRDDAEQIQRRLAELGYYPGTDNGIWGTASRNALRAFKASHRLSDPDEWDAATEQALSAVQAAHSLERTAVQKPSKSGAMRTKMESTNVRAAAATAAKRPAQAGSPAKSPGRPISSGIDDALRPPAPIPAAILAAREP